MVQEVFSEYQTQKKICSMTLFRPPRVTAIQGLHGEISATSTLDLVVSAQVRFSFSLLFFVFLVLSAAELLLFRQLWKQSRNPSLHLLLDSFPKRFLQLFHSELRSLYVSFSRLSSPSSPPLVTCCFRIQSPLRSLFDEQLLPFRASRSIFGHHSSALNPKP